MGQGTTATPRPTASPPAGARAVLARRSSGSLQASRSCLRGSGGGSETEPPDEPPRATLAHQGLGGCSMRRPRLLRYQPAIASATKLSPMSPKSLNVAQVSVLKL